MHIGIVQLEIFMKLFSRLLHQFRYYLIFDGDDDGIFQRVYWPMRVYAAHINRINDILYVCVAAIKYK